MAQMYEQRRNAASSDESSLSADDKAKIRTIITADPNCEVLVSYAQALGDRLNRAGMTRSQVRNIFSEARRIEFLWTRDQAAAVKRLSLLRPKMSYQAAKEGKSALLCAVLTEAINIVMVQPDKNAAFEKFMDFFEADLAYHRKAGGK